MEEEAFPVPELKDRDQQNNDIPRWLSDYGGTLDDYAFFPFGARYGYQFLGIDRSTGEILGILDTPAPL